MSEAQAAQMYRKDGSRWVLCEHEALVLGSSIKKSSGLSFGTEEYSVLSPAPPLYDVKF